MPLHRRTWQKTETRVAKIIGGKRIAGSGSAGEEGRLGDVFHPLFEVEVKQRKRVALKTWFEVVIRRARTRKIPLLVLKQTGASRLYAVLRLEDLARLTGYDGSGDPLIPPEDI